MNKYYGNYINYKYFGNLALPIIVVVIKELYTTGLYWNLYFYKKNILITINFVKLILESINDSMLIFLRITLKENPTIGEIHRYINYIIIN